MRRQLTLIILITVVCFGCNNTNSTKFNLDFEYVAENNQPAQWSMPDKSYHGYVSELDSGQKKLGRYSLHMSQIDSEKADGQFSLKIFPHQWSVEEPLN